MTANCSCAAPRLMLAAPASASGKTLVTCALLRLLQRMQLRVQAFKCGPDYIDPLFHRQVLGLPSVNLDTFFTGRELTAALFAEHAAAADLSVIEGVMGYFDGAGGIDAAGSSADLADALDVPVVLVVSAEGMGKSVAALVQGFCSYEEHAHIRGVILNRVSAAAYPRIKAAIEAAAPVSVYGYLPKRPEFMWQSRHLGLLLPGEIASFREQLDAAAAVLETTVDVPALLELARDAPVLHAATPESCAGLPAATGKKFRVGIAQDEAFCFYYEDNLRLLAKLGAELLPFSPLHDTALPPLDGLVFGGGYPELHAQELSRNTAFRQSVKAAIAGGMPVLAECGGFLYLQETLYAGDGAACAMVGALPGAGSNQGKLVRFGYAEFSGMAFACPKTLCVRGHEFHYFDSTDNGDAFSARKPVSCVSWHCMKAGSTMLAGFPHLYYYSEPALAIAFAAQCRLYAGIP